MLAQKVYCELRIRKDCEGYFTVESGDEVAREKVLPTGWNYVNIDGDLVVGCAKCSTLIAVDQKMKNGRFAH